MMHGGVGRLYLSYLWPNVAGMLVTSFYVLVDTILIGRALGSVGLASLELTLPLHHSFAALGSLFGLGGATLFATSLGRKQGVLLNSLSWGLSISLLLWFAGIRSLPQIVNFLGAQGLFVPYVVDYARMLFYFCPFFILTPLLAPFVANDQAPRLVMLGCIAGGLTNILLDIWFILGLGWGMRGAGLATGLAATLNMAILCTRFNVSHSRLRLRGPWRFRETGRIILNGLSSFMGELTASGILILFNYVLLKQSDHLALAAYGIIANISIFSVLIFTGIGQALQPIASANYGYGTKAWRRVARVRNLSLLSAFLTGTFLCSLGQFFPDLLVSLFIPNDPELLAVAVRGVSLYFWGFIPMAINVVAGFYFQALGFSRQAILLAFGRGVVFVSLGFLVLPHYFGLTGVWLVIPWAETLSLGLAFLLAHW